MQPLKIFISSTYIDLKNYRQAAIEIVNRYKCVPLAMEFFMSQPKEPELVAKKEIEESDVFIGIYAHRYGFVPDKQDKSITQLEYELAKKKSKERLCFVVDEDFPLIPAFCEHNKYDKLESFLKIVKQENTISFFSSIADFASKLAPSLGKLLLERYGTPEQKERIAAGDKFIPIAPIPFIAHPYPLPQNFTGREAEKALLSNWFYNTREPMLVLEAIGGMGKTALSWVWLKQEILEKNIELDGIIWWSFYDAPFETFLLKLYHYVTSKEVTININAYFSGELSQLFSILYNNNFLLVLDGFERALLGYSSMSAMYIQEKDLRIQPHYRLTTAHKDVALPQLHGIDDWNKSQREPVYQCAAKLLQALTSGHSKTLMTTRLFPSPLEHLIGVKHEFLAGLSRSDAVRFLRSEGIAGTRAELELAGEIYAFHPLMLKQLSTAIKRTFLQDIADAFHKNIIDQQVPQKILHKSFQLLNDTEKQVATTVSVFRSAFTFDDAKAMFPEMDEDKLWDILCSLQHLGFLLYNKQERQFDFHPILRSFLYDNLTAKSEVHERAVQYFEALPKVEKVIKLENLTPVIELYHHLVGAGKFDEARDLYYNRLYRRICFQFSNYNLQIQLLKELFLEGEYKPSRLTKEADQAWTINVLANCYSVSGQPGKAMPLFLRAIGIYEKENNINQTACSLQIAAYLAKIQTGQLLAASVHLRKSIALCLEIKDEFLEAIGHHELGRVLAYQGYLKGLPKDQNMRKVTTFTAEDELVKSDAYWKKTNQSSVDSDYRSLFFLLAARQARSLGQISNLPYKALKQANQALKSAEAINQDDRFVTPYLHFVRAYWLLSESLIESQCSHKSSPFGSMEIRFYDEHFQKPVETLILKSDNTLEVAEHCLNEAL